MLYVHCKNCGKQFTTSLQVDPSELLIDRPFNSMEICTHCKSMGFYVRDDFQVSREAHPRDPEENIA